MKRKLRPSHSLFVTIIALCAIVSSACSGNDFPAVSPEQTKSRATETITPPSPISITPVVTAEASPAAQITLTRPANTPRPAATINSGSMCTEIGQSWTSPVDGVILVCVPAGEFLMGAADSDPLANRNEKPQHRVYLDAFWIDRTEVTNVNFAKCVADGACRPKVYEVSAMTYTPYAIHPDYQDFPAFLHEADVAAAYCQWAGRRLPTEAEWEKAARGTDARYSPWGNELDCTKASYYECRDTLKAPNPTGTRCGYSANCQTTRVDDHLTGASPYGALNMAGNVWEWVADWYAPEYYASSPTSNPTGPDKGDFKVRRGGGAESLAQDLRATSRASGAPQHYFDAQMGLRCAASAFVP